MAEVIWTAPALSSLEAIAEVIALENPEAARRLVQDVFAGVAKLRRFPRLGPKIPELRDSLHRQLVVRPCRLFYRLADDRIFVVFIMRGEREFKPEFLTFHRSRD